MAGGKSETHEHHILCLSTSKIEKAFNVYAGDRLPSHHHLICPVILMSLPGDTFCFLKKNPSGL